MDVMNICKTQLLVMAGVTLSSISAVAQNTLPNIILVIEEFYKLKYCSTVVYMVPRA